MKFELTRHTGEHHGASSFAYPIIHECMKRPSSDPDMCDPNRCVPDISEAARGSWDCLFRLRKNHTLSPATIAASGIPRPMPTPRPTFVTESSSSSGEELEVEEVSVADVAEAVASEATEEDVIELELVDVPSAVTDFPSESRKSPRPLLQHVAS